MDDHATPIEIKFEVSSTLRSIYEEMKTGRNNDIVVFGKGRLRGVPASRLILSAISGYFRSYFARWNAEHEVFLDEIAPEIFEL